MKLNWRKRIQNMTDTEQEEIWRTYPEYTFIEVSNLGRIRTRDRTVTRKDETKQLVRGIVLKQHPNNSYMYVAFSVNGRQVNLPVHRAVATCFLPNPNNYPEVNHKDNDPTNNRLNNLEWCTHEYNIAYREKYGIARNRPVIAVNPETSEVFWFDSQMDASRQLGIHHPNINEVVKGKRHMAGEYWFCNADKNAVEKTRAKFGDEIARKVEKLIGENYD